MRLLMLCVFIFIAGCVYNPAISKQARYDLEKPVDCSTAEEDIRILESEKASVADQAKAGAKMVAPAAAARAMLHADYTDREMVASGQYSDDIDSKIREIKKYLRHEIEPGRAKMKKILLVICILFLCGCACAKTAQRNNDLLLTLNTGQTKQEVLQVMGNPSRNERYSTAGKETDVWYYRTDVDLYGTEDDNFTPVVFENGKLAGWGRNFYDERIEYQSQIQ